jgi:hypothetical protein
MKWSGTTEHTGEMINAHKTAGKLNVIKLPGGPRSRWEDQIYLKYHFALALYLTGISYAHITYFHCKNIGC